MAGPMPSRPAPGTGRDRPAEALAGTGLPGDAADVYWREMRLDWLARVLGGPCSSS
jgi:hypothetical protein